MSKNIIVCCDGTGNEFGDSNSNVVKLYQTLICDASQIAYYHPGVGTMGSTSALSGLGKWWTKVIGLAFGYGLSENVADAYQFLMKTFETGDKVFVFGFSRGAYTARALCGLVHFVGLLTEGNEGQIPYAIRMFKDKEFKVAAGFKKTFSRECKPHFVGVWDTVSSVGWVYNAVVFPYTRADSNPDLNIVRHAISLDERRAFFPSNSYGPPHDDHQDVMEVLFSGVHSDVGGSYPEPNSQLSKIPLQWMLAHAEPAGLKVDLHRKAEILGGKKPYVAPDPNSGNQHESLRKGWWIGELWPKTRLVRTDKGEFKNRIRINFGRRRKFDNPLLLAHESIKQRVDYSAPADFRQSDGKDLKRHPFPYKPKNLPEGIKFVNDDYRKPSPALKAGKSGPAPAAAAAS